MSLNLLVICVDQAKATRCNDCNDPKFETNALQIVTQKSLECNVSNLSRFRHANVKKPNNFNIIIIILFIL